MAEISFSTDDIQRFWRNVERQKRTGCYVWTGTKFSHGYGHFSIGNKAYGAHRLQWIVVNGRLVTPNKELHHRCKNKACVNPEHLEEVTRKEHFQRHPRKIKTHCKRGHPRSPQNLWGSNCKLCTYITRNNSRAKEA